MKRKPIKKKKKKKYPRNLTHPYLSLSFTSFAPRKEKKTFLTVDGDDFNSCTLLENKEHHSPLLEVEFVTIPKQTKANPSLGGYPLNQKRYNHLQMVISPS